MNLERELAALAPAIDWPETPDVVQAVAARIEAPPPRRRAPRSRLALALAVVLAAVLAVLAVPPARTAVFDWLGIGSARIVRVDELPALDPSPSLQIFGEVRSLEVARSIAGFPFADPPDDEPAPDEIRVARDARVSYIWRDGQRVRLVISQFPGSATDPEFLKKLASGQTTIERLSVDGDAAVWLEGGPHAVYVLAPDGLVRNDMGWLAGNTLIVDRAGVTVRVEGALTRDEAVELVQAMDR